MPLFPRSRYWWRGSHLGSKKFQQKLQSACVVERVKLRLPGINYFGCPGLLLGIAVSTVERLILVHGWSLSAGFCRSGKGKWRSLSIMLAKTCRLTLSWLLLTTSNIEKMLPHNFPRYSSQEATLKCNSWWAEWQGLVVWGYWAIQTSVEKDTISRCYSKEGHVKSAWQSTLSLNT